MSKHDDKGLRDKPRAELIQTIQKVVPYNDAHIAARQELDRRNTAYVKLAITLSIVGILIGLVSLIVALWNK